MIPDLYHFTCDHGRRGLGDAGTLIPVATRMPHLYPEGPSMGADMVWLTTMPIPDRYALGLTSYLIRCDRTRYRYRVTREDRALALPWAMVRDNADHKWRQMAEALPHDPTTWWVVPGPVRVTFDPLS